MEKVDLKKELKNLYGCSAKEVAFIDVPKMNFLMIDGMGNPNTSQDYKDAVEALFSVSYALKFMVKKWKTAVDYGVMPLEGLWWTDDMTEFNVESKDKWKWTAMIMQPKYVTKDIFNEAIKQVEKKKNPAALHKIRFESMHEGLSAQIMHIGPYADEEPTIKKLHNSIKENRYYLRGKHREIYLSDPRKSAPKKMKTIIRQPVEKI